MKKTTLVIGASIKPERYSNKAIKRLVDKKVEVKAIGLRSGIVAGVTIDTELIPYKDIHTVTLYLNPSRQKQYYNYIIDLRPERVIFNPGTENYEFIKLLQEENIETEAACTLVLLGTGQY
ncbi:CoA-binding protein [uncultured Tenacibaculum sp.]|uniref:CoA-binding protein n=1 Tax=uncultured Tenacibaculum sp. TaxID=174713 RepID=UPI002618AA29|nr:CoA-binding protein [uncultured Tenacibaculum sp.]